MTREYCDDFNSSLPWGYDASMVGGTILYGLTALFGYETWKIHLPGGNPPGPLLEFFLYAGSIGLDVPVALRNVYRSYRDGTGKMRSFLEAARPLVSFTLALVLFLTWVNFSPNDILLKDTRMVFYASGTLYANLSCRLIVSQMSNTRAELFNVFLMPLAMAVVCSIYIPGLTVETELMILYALSLLLTVLHIHYGVCVVVEMCRHLRIDALRIKDHGHVRLIAKDDNSSDESEIDMNDVEVVVASNSSAAAAGPSVLQV